MAASLGMALALQSVAPVFAASSTDEVVSVEGAMKRYGNLEREKLAPIFAMHNVPYPPKQMTWVGLKKEKVLLLFAKDEKSKQHCVLSYPIYGASGVSGPKLKEGDKQVPEGFYRIARFRPKVIAHMGMDLDYPNDEDRKNASAEKRHNLGGDIMIHGSYWSTGCLAMGNDEIEELFVLAHDTKVSNITVLLAPCDLTSEKPDVDFSSQPAWLPFLYKRLGSRMKVLPIKENIPRKAPPTPTAMERPVVRR